MAKLKIYTFPDPVLAQMAVPIERVESKHRELAESMLETMYDAPGIGLAANQVGVLQRMIVVDTEYELEELREDGSAPSGFEVVGSSAIRKKDPKVLINPTILYREGSRLFEEGCLSVPEFAAEVKRSEKIKVSFRDTDGLTRELSADGLLAIAIQHEMDHLDGRLFIDRLSPLKKESAKKKLLKERAIREAQLAPSGIRSTRKTKGF